MNAVDLAPARTALVHDWLNQVGGAENVLEELVSLFPKSPIYTSIYAPEQMPDAYRGWPIHTSFMQHLPGITNRHQRYLPVYPLAFQRMDLSEYDLVISNKSGFCHGVRTATEGGDSRQAERHAIHICYCLTPTRFLWLYDQYRARERISPGLNLALQPTLAWLRRWDRAAAQRVDHFVAISHEIQQRIATIYGRRSTIIYPPVDTDFFTPGMDSPIGDYFLIVSRLIPYKRIDLAVQAFRELPDERLVIVGDGRDRRALETEAGPNVSFLGYQSRSRIRELMRGCKAFIFPGLEDFGITPVEALSCGRPVVAFAGGGALDTVIPGLCGELFSPQTVESLLNVLQHFKSVRYPVASCRSQAERFSRQTFCNKMVDYVDRVLTGQIASDRT